jgi:hypothetical protein
MPELTAAYDTHITYSEDSWSAQKHEAPPYLTADANGFTYSAEFAQLQHLPEALNISVDDVRMVVTGWGGEDSQWHMGILFTPEFSAERGGRWCQIALWAESEGETATRAGGKLAAVLGKPFRLVPQPTAQASDARKAEDAAHSPHKTVFVLKDPPIDLGDWAVFEENNTLQVVRNQRWGRALLARAIFFFFLIPIFSYLAFGALSTSFARVQPDWLPLIGVIIIVVLLVWAINLIRQWMGIQKTLIDERSGLVRQVVARNGYVKWQSPFEGIDYVVVSHITNRRRPVVKAETGELTAYSQITVEAWLHLYSERRGFIEVCNIVDIEGLALNHIWQDPEGDLIETRQPIDLLQINTPLHHAALLIARQIGVPAFAEQRR